MNKMSTLFDTSKTSVKGLSSEFLNLSNKTGISATELAEAGYEVGKVDVDKEPSLAQQYKIMSIPTLLVFKGGKETARFVGLTSKAELEAALQ